MLIVLTLIWNQMSNLPSVFVMSELEVKSLILESVTLLLFSPFCVYYFWKETAALGFKLDVSVPAHTVQTEDISVVCSSVRCCVQKVYRVSLCLSCAVGY